MNQSICFRERGGDLLSGRDMLFNSPASPLASHGAEQPRGPAQQYAYKNRSGENAEFSKRKCAGKFAIAGMLILSACASTPVPQAALQAAELAITNAEQARVADYAAPELGEARSKLTAARTAVQEEDMVLAERLAEQSRLGAELAIARAEVAKTKAVNDEMQKSTDVIQQEMQRNTGSPQ